MKYSASVNELMMTGWLPEVGGMRLAGISGQAYVPVRNALMGLVCVQRAAQERGWSIEGAPPHRCTAQEAG